MVAVSGISSVFGPSQNRLPSRKFLRDFLYKNTPRESVLQRSKNARNFGNGRQQKYPNLDFDRNWLNTGIRVLAAVPSNLNNSPKSGHFWSYSLGITYVTIFSGLCPHSSLKSLLILSLRYGTGPGSWNWWVFRIEILSKNQEITKDESFRNLLNHFEITQAGNTVSLRYSYRILFYLHARRQARRR